MERKGLHLLIILIFPIISESKPFHPTSNHRHDKENDIYYFDNFGTSKNFITFANHLSISNDYVNVHDDGE